jgi:hypothetical protein
MEIYDKNSVDISYTLNNLGLSYSFAGKYKKALVMYKKSRKIIIKNY